MAPRTLTVVMAILAVGCTAPARNQKLRFGVSLGRPKFGLTSFGQPSWANWDNGDMWDSSKRTKSLMAAALTWPLTDEAVRLQQAKQQLLQSFNINCDPSNYAKCRQECLQMKLDSICDLIPVPFPYYRQVKKLTPEGLMNKLHSLESRQD